MEKAAELLDGYGRIGCFLDRDEAGRRTLDALAKRYGARVADRSSLYDGCKDLNEYLLEKPLYFDPFGQIEFAHFGHNIIAPCKVLV